MTTKAAKLRLFVAVYPPPAVAESLAAALTRLNLPSIRATPIEQIHLTAHFIGETDARRLEEVIESVERSASGLTPPTLTTRALITLPEKGPPRLVAVELEPDASLAEFHRRLVTRLARAPRTREGFLPHMTLGRFAPGARADRIHQALTLAPFTVAQAVLVQSILKPDHAEHRALRAVPFA